MGAFQSSHYLSTVTIPHSVKKIEDDAFADCYSLKTILFDGTTDEWEQILCGGYADWMTWEELTVCCTDGKVIVVNPIPSKW